MMLKIIMVSNEIITLWADEFEETSDYIRVVCDDYIINKYGEEEYEGEEYIFPKSNISYWEIKNERPKGR